MSFLYQIYSPTTPLAGPSVVVWDGALGAQTLATWDPTGGGYYSHNPCPYGGGQEQDPECNYDRVKHDLRANGFSELQVQAIFLKSANAMPVCDLKNIYCLNQIGPNRDAYIAELFMGDILRYLKQGLSGGSGPRYTNLQQVFLTTRIYGGYANGQVNSGSLHAECLNPEPFAYEEGFAVQRLVVAQVNGGSDPLGYSGGPVDLTSAPWFDWGPYLWASGPNVSPSTGLFWCNGSSGTPCFGAKDVRYGDPNHPTQYWGDFTHPTATAEQKVGGALVNFLNNPWLMAWIHQ